MNRKYIVAGNHMEFIDYCSRKQREGIDIREMYYVTGAAALRGLSECHGFFIGTYNDRPDINQIIDQIRIINSRPHIIWVDELVDRPTMTAAEFIKFNLNVEKYDGNNKRLD